MSDLSDMGCCSCFGFLRKPQKSVVRFRASGGHLSEEFLLPQDMDDADGSFYNEDDPDFLRDGDNGPQQSIKRPEEIIFSRAQSGFVCREVPVKETKKVIFSEDETGNRMVNEYVRLYKIGVGSYGKVVSYRSTKDGKLYAIKPLPFYYRFCINHI